MIGRAPAWSGGEWGQPSDGRSLLPLPTEAGCRHRRIHRLQVFSPREVGEQHLRRRVGSISCPTAVLVNVSMEKSTSPKPEPEKLRDQLESTTISDKPDVEWEVMLKPPNEKSKVYVMVGISNTDIKSEWKKSLHNCLEQHLSIKKQVMHGCRLLPLLPS